MFSNARTNAYKLSEILKKRKELEGHRTSDVLGLDALARTVGRSIVDSVFKITIFQVSQI